MTTRLNFGCGGRQTIIINTEACLQKGEWQVTIQYIDFVIYIPRAVRNGNSLIGNAFCVFAPDGYTHEETVDICKTLAEQGYLSTAMVLREDIIPYLQDE